MGVYDSVKLLCPKCHVAYYAQSKGGDCIMKTYTINTAPQDVMSDVNRHAPFECEECGSYFRVIWKPEVALCEERIK